MAPGRPQAALAIAGTTLLLLPIALPQQSAIERGMDAFRRRDFEAARKNFEQAIQENPRRALGYRLLGMACTAEGNHKAALDPYARACAIDPHEENACYYKGHTLYLLDRYEEAIRAFESTLKNTSERGRPLLGMALTYEALGKTSEAERYYRSAIHSGEKRAQADYGMFLFRHDRAAESLEWLRKAGDIVACERVRKTLENSPRQHDTNRTVPVHFEQSKLDMVVRNGARGEKHQIEAMVAGVAVLDYDNDGWPDVFLANGADVASLQKTDASFHNRLFRNNHDGTFSDVTERVGVAGAGYSMGVAAADYDNDGRVDLFVTGVRGNTLYHNRGDGTFEDVTAKAGLAGDSGWAVAAGWFDADNDGWLDLFVVRYVAWDPLRERYCGDPRPGYRTYCHPQYYQALPNALYRNRGDGTFRDVSAESGIAAHLGKGMGITFGDYDGDGRLDIFVANDTEPNFLFHNEGNGKFREVGLAAGVAYNEEGKTLSSMGADFRDYDNDGREDIFITALTNETFPLFRNLGRGRFAEMTLLSGLAAGSLSWSGWSTGVFDFNNDGYKDVFTANGNVQDNAELNTSRKSRQPNTVFLNRGNGTFQTQILPGEAFHRGAAFGDFDRAGRIDAVVTRLNESPIVLHNVTADAGHWIVLQLRGTRSNRDGIGARVHIVTGTGEQWNRLTTSIGYAGSSQPMVHFGLGGATRIRRVEIEWPSGMRQTLVDVAADRYLVVTEP